MYNRKAIFTLAARLVKTGKHNLSSALKYAWTLAKMDNLKLLTFTKKSGTTTTRVVSSSLDQYVTRKGTGRKKPTGLKLFVDLEKICKGVNNAIISTYKENIISYT